MFVDLVEFIVKKLVDNPDEVEISQFDDEGVLVIEVRVAEGDAGRVIGRGGRVVNAIRTVVDSLASKEGQRINIEVI